MSPTVARGIFSILTEYCDERHYLNPYCGETHYLNSYCDERHYLNPYCGERYYLNSDYWRGTLSIPTVSKRHFQSPNCRQEALQSLLSTRDTSIPTVGGAPFNVGDGLSSLLLARPFLNPYCSRDSFLIPIVGETLSQSLLLVRPLFNHHCW